MSIRNPVQASRWRHTALAVALSMSLGGVAMAQSTTGSIFGQAPAAPGESVVVTNRSGVSREVPVDSSGRFRVGNLPVGTYTVALKQGGTVIDSHNVGLSAGAGTAVTFDGTAGTTSLGAVTVNATSVPAIDVSNVNSSLTITAADLQRLPVGRNAESIALLSPGTVAGSNYFGNAVSFGGAGVTENAYYVNGFNTGEPYRNTGGFQLPYGSIEQQQTFTGGYSAQYGRSDGGVINQIGKRGTNKWHFGAQVAWAPRALSEGGKNTYYPTYSNIPAGYGLSDPSKQGQLYHYRKDNKSWETIYSGYFGGPLIEDKLYLFVSAETTKTKGRNVETVDLAKDISYSDTESHYYGKLDWNINDTNTLELTKLISNKSGDDVNGNGSAYDFNYDTLQRGARSGPNNVSKHSADFTIAKYTSYITDAATLSVLYGKGDFKNPYVYPGATDLPYISGASNQRGGQNIVNSQLSPNKFASDASNHTRGLRVDFTYQLGSHLLGVGIDNMEYRASNQGQDMSGPGYYWAYSVTSKPTVNLSPGLGVGPTGGDGYYVRKRVTIFKTSMSLQQKAYYLQDVWNVTDQFQLNLGIRNDHFTNNNDLGVAFVDEKNQWEPRIGASWDVNGDSSFKVYGNAGRYYLALPNNVAERAANRSTLTYQYFNYTGIDSNGVPTGLTPIGGVNGAPPPGPVTPDGETGLPKDARQVTAANLKAQYQDEYILGFDKALGADWIYGAKATYRQLKTAIDDECSPGQIATKMAATGLNPDDYSDSLYGAAYCRLINPGLTNDMIVAKNDGSGYATVTMTRQDWGFTEKAKRKYAALDLYLEHPFDGTWQGRFAYTFARNTGNTEGQVRSDFGQADVSKTEDWDAWQLMDHANGDLANSRRHSFKAFGAYQITPEWLISGTLLIQSGTPKECLGFFGTQEADPVSYGGDYHYCFGKPTPPGSTGFTPWTKKLNLGLRYAPAFADHKLAFQMNVYNVFNEQKVVQINPNSVTDPYSVSSTWNIPAFYEQPRYVRFSVSYDY